MSANLVSLIRTRSAFVAEVKDQLAKGRSVLILGERGVGKSHTLGVITQSLPNAIFLPNVSSKKTALMTITERLFKDGKIEDYRYFADWRDAEPRARKLNIDAHVELVQAAMTGYTLVIDNLDLCTERAIKDVITPLAQHNALLAAGSIATPTKAKRVAHIRDRFVQIGLPPMTDDELVTMLWALLDRDDYDARTAKVIETKVLGLAHGRPAVVADLVEQLRNAVQPGALALDQVRDLDHTLTNETRVNLVFPLFIGFVAFIAGTRYFARGTDDLSLYVIAGMFTAAAMAVRPVMWRLMPTPSNR